MSDIRISSNLMVITYSSVRGENRLSEFATVTENSSPLGTDPKNYARPYVSLYPT